MFECFYVDGKKVGLSYGYDSDEEIETVNFDEERVELEDRAKYLAIHRLRELDK